MWVHCCPGFIFLAIFAVCFKVRVYRLPTDLFVACTAAYLLTLFWRWGVLVFLNFWHFSPERTQTGSLGTTESEVWIGNLNIKARKSTKHKLHKIWRSLKFCKKSAKQAHPTDVKHNCRSRKKIQNETRMHSSRMRTGRTLTVFRKLEQTPPPKIGADTPPPKNWSRHPPKIWSRHPPEKLEQTPPPCEQNEWQTAVKILPRPKLRFGR